MTFVSTDPLPGGGDLYSFHNSAGQYGVTATITTNTGRHLYENAHPNELLNQGRSINYSAQDPEPTIRQFISDFTVQILADAYDFTVTLPSELVVDPEELLADPDKDPRNAQHTSSAHTSFDSQTGTLFIQGLPDAVNETFAIDPDGDQIVVSVSYTLSGNAYVFTSRFFADQVSEIVLAGNGGTDALDIDDPDIAALVREVHYVVSSNDDSNDDGVTAGDGIVDLNSIVPGRQVALRAAIVDANGTAGGAARSIYVPRGIYNLDLGGSGDALGDIDITGNVSIIGAGPGSTVINGSTLSTADRLFEVSGSNRSLNISGVTLTGGNIANSAGGAIYAHTSATLALARTAVVGNQSAQRAGGVRVADATATIVDSVFSNNQSGFQGGAVSVTGTANVKIGSTVFAVNTATTNYPNVEIAAGGTATNLGYNLTTNASGSGTFFSTNLGDVIGGTVNYVVTGSADNVNAADNALTLREAVQAANSSPGVIWVPAWHHRLTRSATGTDGVLINDLDVTATGISIVGVGPGYTVIDASGLRNTATDLNNRAFEVSSGSLNVSRATITGGLTTGTSAGNAFMVRSGAGLTIADSTLVNHVGAANGVAVRSIGGNLTVQRSVFTNNTSTGASAGVYATDGGSLTIGGSIFALNSGATHDNVFANSSVNSTSLGYNLYDDHNAAGNTFAFNGTGDLSGTPDYVVTSARDSFSHVDDAFSLSLREAIDFANQNAGGEIWLPAWKFLLTRPGATGLDDHDLAFGDLEIIESLTLRGAGSTAVEVKQTLAQYNDADPVFDLIGDFDGDGVTTYDDGSAGGGDYLTWLYSNGQSTDLRADADDDGDVDYDDYDLWVDGYGNILTRNNVANA